MIIGPPTGEWRETYIVSGRSSENDGTATLVILGCISLLAVLAIVWFVMTWIRHDREYEEWQAEERIKHAAWVENCKSRGSEVQLEPYQHFYKGRYLTRYKEVCNPPVKIVEEKPLLVPRVKVPLGQLN